MRCYCRQYLAAQVAMSDRLVHFVTLNEEPQCVSLARVWMQQNKLNLIL